MRCHGDPEANFTGAAKTLGVVVSATNRVSHCPAAERPSDRTLGAMSRTVRDSEQSVASPTCGWSLSMSSISPATWFTWRSWDM